MEFEGRGRTAGTDGLGAPAKFLQDAPATGRAEVELRDPSRALALLQELGPKVTEESLVLMPILLSLLKHEAAIVVRQSVISGTRFFCNVLEEIALQVHQMGEVGRWLVDMWAWMVKFKDAVCGLALEPGSVSIRALAVKFLEAYILLFTTDINYREGIFMEEKTRGFDISQLIGVHPIFEAALLSFETNKCLGLLLDLLQSASTSSGSLTIIVINCLSAIARRRPVHYSRILSALLAFDPDSRTKEGGHVASVRHSLKTAFIGFLRCTHHPSMAESRDKLLKALRSLNPGEGTEQIIRQVDKMSRNAEYVSRDSRSTKDDKTLSQVLVSGDAISKRSMMQAGDGTLIPDGILVKRTRHSLPVTAAAPLDNDFAQDDDDGDADNDDDDDDDDNGVDASNGFPSNVSLLDSDLTAAEKMIVMIGALLAGGEKGAESLELLISQMQADLLADIVILNMKHLPKGPLPLYSRIGSYASRTSSFDSSLQMAPPAAVAATSDTSDMSPQLLSSPSNDAVLCDMPSSPNTLAETKRDPRRDPRRLDPRRATAPTGAQTATLNLESANDVLSGLDGSLNRPMSASVAAKTDSSLVLSTSKCEAVISECSLSLSADTSTLQGSPILLDQPTEKGPCLAVKAASDAPLSPICIDQDLEPSTPSEAMGNDGVDISMSESDQYSSAVSSGLVSEASSHDLPLLPLFIELTDEQKNLLSRLAVARITESHKQTRATGCTHARFCLLAHLVSQADVDTIEMLQKYIVMDYHHQKGHELAMYVLYHLHSIMVSGAEEQCYSSAATIYEQFLLALAKSLCNILPASDKSFSRLLNEAPFLPESTLSLLEELCHSPGYDQRRKDVREGDRITQGLGAVWSLILARPHTRQACLNIALKCAIDSQDEVRGKAIRLVANKLYPLNYVTENIEKFAKTMILSFVDQQIPDKDIITLGTTSEQRLEVENREKPRLQSSRAVSFTQAQQYSSLYFALCIKKPELLQLVFDIYGRAPKAVRQSIHWHVPDLVRKLGSSCSELLRIISVSPEGSENLLTLVLQILTEEMTPPADLIAKVKHLHQTKFKDAVILIPILSSLSKDEVLPIFPRLVDLPIEKFQTALARILQGSAHTGPALTPAEVLVAIHDINPEKDGVPLKKIMDACTTCFEQRTVFTQHVLVKALNELIQRTPLPLLFMRTVIQAIDAFPTLVDFVMEILSKLVTMQIWRMPKLWAGFLKCVSQTQPHSFNVLLQLPPPQLENVLQKHVNLKGPLATYANQAHVRSSLPRPILEVLGLINEQQRLSR